MPPPPPSPRQPTRSGGPTATAHRPMSQGQQLALSAPQQQQAAPSVAPSSFRLTGAGQTPTAQQSPPTRPLMEFSPPAPMSPRWERAFATWHAGASTAAAGPGGQPTSGHSAAQPLWPPQQRQPQPQQQQQSTAAFLSRHNTQTFGRPSPQTGAARQQWQSEGGLFRAQPPPQTSPRQVVAVPTRWSGPQQAAAPQQSPSQPASAHAHAGAAVTR